MTQAQYRTFNIALELLLPLDFLESVMRTRYLCFGIVVILLCVSGCVDPKRLASLENRIAAMEMENNRQMSQQKEAQNRYIKKSIKSLEDQLKGGHIVTKEEYARLKYDIRVLKKELQALEGSIDEIKHKFKEYTEGDRQVISTRLKRLDDAISKNYEKVINLEKYMGFEPSASAQMPATKPTVSEGSVQKDPEQGLYDLAKKLFDDGDIENSRIHFGNFINKYPDSQNADNARFWIADSYYAEKWFGKAILEYQKVLDNYPDSNKLAAARLKQGYAFAELGEKANARITLKTLVRLHPESKEAQYAQEKLKNLN